MKQVQLVALLSGTILIAACAAAPEVLAPPCSGPAVLDGVFNRRTPGYLISVNDSVTNIEFVVHDLANKYTFRPDSIMSAVKIFSVKTLTPEALAGLRCEPTIRGISFDEPTRIARMRSNKRFEFARTARPTRKSDALLLAAQPQR
jgi:hypothetical protein